MSYIEREAFIESQQHLYCDNCARRKDSKGKLVYEIGDAPCRACGIMDVLDAVEDAPTSNVREVVKARWGHRWICSNMSGYEYACSCSECGKPTYRMSLLEKMPNYCPNCGAQVVETKKEDKHDE